ncbi:GDSL-type esterase/lipase family protein [Longispora sp. K20-0274]|uniref:GDSL-type esterase/lipase family protein n=1 Tax=Longispora sp. K20-0274 TaxID=3088255 RepID=UPI00399ADAD9
MRKLPWVALLATVSAVLPATPAAAGHRWSGAWTAATMRPSGSPFLPTWAEGGFDHQSLRQVVRLSAGGSELRLRLSNVYGGSPLRVTGATVGRTDTGAAVLPDTIRTVRFGRAASTVIPAHGTAVSDPVALPVPARGQVTVTLYFDRPTGPATYHMISMANTYRAAGDHSRDTDPAAFTDTVPPGFGSWYYLEGVEVTGPPTRDAVVTYGESTTDGFGATPNADNRYPDALSERLIAAGQHRPVLNAAISSNKLLSGSACFGDSAVARFGRDVLNQPRVGTVIASHGMNDILRDDDSLCGGTGPDTPVTLQRLIDGHRALIAAAHARRVRIIGATLMPFTWPGGPADPDTLRRDQLRKDLNTWIRTSGEYDSVADFERAIDPNGTGTIPDGYHMGDHLHPNPLGYRTIASAVDLAALR